MKRKYFTEEERKAAQREANRRYYQNNKEKILEQKAEYRQNNKEKVAKQKAEYYQDNKEKILEQQAEYRQNNKEKIAAQQAGYYATPKGRAVNLLKGYKRSDEKYNRGECTLTDDWIVQNIFSQPCHYCGETDYHELGCDRIDNSLPHTPDNVVPCCAECNIKKQKTPYDEFMKMIGKIA